MRGEDEGSLARAVRARVLRLLGDVTCVSASPWPVDAKGLPAPELLPLPNTEDVAFFYELMAATRSGIEGPAGLPGNTFPNPIDIDGDASWWAWWHAASASEIRAGLPEGWARELGSTEAGYLGICARLVSSCLVSLLFGQWKLSAATYPESWFTGGYSLSERFADRTRMNLDVLALSEVRTPAHPVTATIWQGRQRAEASRLPPRATRFTALEGDNPFRRLRGGLSGRSVLGKLMGLPESPDSLVFPLRWATAMHTSLADLPELGLTRKQRRDLSETGVGLAYGTFRFPTFAGIVQAMARPADLDEAHRLAVEIDRVSEKIEKKLKKDRTPKLDEALDELRALQPVLEAAYDAQFEVDGLDLRQLAVLGLELRRAFDPLGENIASIGGAFVPNRRVSTSIPLALVGLTLDEAAEIQAMFGGFGIDGFTPTPTPQLGWRSAKDGWVHLGPRFRMRASVCVLDARVEPSVRATPDFLVDGLPNDRFRPDELEAGRHADDLALRLLRGYAAQGRPTENLMRIFEDTAALVELLLQMDELLLAANDFLAGTGVLAESLRGTVEESGVGALFDGLKGFPPGQVIRYLTRQVLTDAYLGWVAARYSEASAACLYPFIPWMASPSARDEIDAALGPAEGVALGAVADGLAVLAALWGEAAARFAEDIELPDATAIWAKRRDSIPAEFSVIRARSGLVSLLGTESGSTSALASVLQLVSSSDLTTIELVPLAQVRAWLKTAREARFADEGLP